MTNLKENENLSKIEAFTVIHAILSEESQKVTALEQNFKIFHQRYYFIFIFLFKKVVFISVHFKDEKL